MASPRGLELRVLFIFFLFVLLHQTDKLLIGPLKGPISETFGLSHFQFGLVVTGALIVGTVLYPLWGYLYDRYTRPKLLALASFIWGSTTWLSAIAPTYPTFLAARATTGIDDSAYPGLYSLLSDYFGPERRGKAYGLLQLAQPMGYLVGMVLALTLAPQIGWRRVFFLTGFLGVLLAGVIWWGVKERARGEAEPEFEALGEVPRFRFSWAAAREIFRRKTMWFIMAQGFAGVFPWNVLTYFFFDYLARERGYDEQAILVTMGPVVLLVAVGYFLGGYLGDVFFARTRRGRLLVAMTGVLLGMVFLVLTMRTPLGQETRFMVLLFLTALVMPWAAPNVVATIHDVTLPEVRSTAQSLEYFVENFGAATAPALAGWIADRTSMGTAILSVSTLGWFIGGILFLGAVLTVEQDVRFLRQTLAQRAQAARRE